MQAALDDAELPATALDFISAHGTATIFNDLMEAKALSSLFAQESPTVPVNSIKGAIGHCLGAAGALEAVMAVRVLEEQLIPPTAGLEALDPLIRLQLVTGQALARPVRHLLSTSSGFGGINASLVFSHAATERI
jgi:3-oxoacyl-(acyl-carrier-protein) synthase